MANKILKLTNVKLMMNMRNFSGRGDDWNPEGYRNFFVKIDEETAQMLSESGVKVKTFIPKPDSPYSEEGPTHAIKIKLKFNQNDNGTYYPQILVIPESREYKTIITPIDASELDRMDIIEAETMYISCVPWERKGSSGVGLWLRQAAFIIREDPFAARYREIPIYGRDQNE